MLGGKQMPSVLYKARVSALERDIESLTAVITSIGSIEKHYE
jgi:hypothetical protein